LEKARLMKIYPQPRPKGHGIALAVRITFETENSPGSTRVTMSAIYGSPSAQGEADVSSNSATFGHTQFSAF
jgi:hypothetical protein